MTGAPDDVEAWTDLLDAWCRRLDDHGPGATAWAAGHAWGPDYPLAIYTEASPGRPLSRASPAAEVLERRSGAPGSGVALAGWEFSVSGRGGDGVRPGLRIVHDAVDLAHLASRGVGLVRLAMAWVVLQPDLRGGLDGGALDQLGSMLDAARAQEVAVVLDLHNCARYTEASGRVRVLGPGGDGLEADDLADLWLRLSRWVRAERGRSATVAGHRWSHLHEWAQTHPRAWVDDPAGATVHEAHHYVDTASAAGARSGSCSAPSGADGSGGAVLPYAVELAAARAASGGPGEDGEGAGS